eukprot:2588270-Rhodomonas_salina.1
MLSARSRALLGRERRRREEGGGGGGGGGCWGSTAMGVHVHALQVIDNVRSPPSSSSLSSSCSFPPALWQLFLDPSVAFVSAALLANDFATYPSMPPLCNALRSRWV